MYSGKDVNELLEITCKLSKGLEDYTYYLKTKGIDAWDKQYDFFNKVEKIRKYISFPKVNDLFTEITRIVSVGLNSGLEDLSMIRKKGVKEWERKYDVLNYYSISERFSQDTGIYRMRKGIKRIYKICYGDEWKEKLNEKTD